MPRSLRQLLLVSMLAIAGGCHLMETSDPISRESILQAIKPAPDAVTLGIYWVRLPHTSDGGDGGLWNHVHEDRLPVELRGRLADNGLRAGVVSAVPPDQLLKLLDPKGDADMDQSGLGELQKTGVTVRTRQMRSGEELPLNTSPILPVATLSLVEGEKTVEQSFQRAQGVYILEAAPAAGEQTWLSLLPTIQHGDPRLSLTPDETGVISYGSTTRQTRALPDLAIAADLAPGEMLLVTNLPGSSQQLGGLLHAPTTDTGCERRAILVRVAATPESRAFLDDEVGNGE